MTYLNDLLLIFYEQRLSKKSTFPHLISQLIKSKRCQIAVKILYHVGCDLI